MQQLRLSLLTTILFLFGQMALAQVYLDGGNTRHRFAQMTVGAEMLYVPEGGSAQFLQDGELQMTDFPARIQPRLSIGGTHFWGHAEFYVAFDLPNLVDTEVAPGTDIFTSTGVETAFKYYPWRLEKGKVRPFVGSGMAVPGVRISQGDQRGRYANQTIVPITAGLTYQTGKLLWEVGGRYRTGSNTDYFLSRTQSTTLEPSRWSAFAGVRFQFETTLSAEAPYQDGRTDAIVEKLGEMGKLSGFSVAVGPSSSFNIMGKKGTYNEGEREFLGSQPGSGVFVEFGLGYYYQPWDAHANFAYRNYSSGIGAYDYQQQVKRRAFTLEAYKFLGDYHGFVPFAGPAISYDRWSLAEADGNTLVNSQADNHVLPGLTFGWDIRPDKAQWFILRTNLRYFPFQMDTPGDTRLALNQLEFNFIQLVIYPGRLQAMRRM